MESLLSVDTSDLTGHRIPINTSVEYNSQSQRIEVKFASKPKHIRETEAEGVAYVVSQYLGLRIHAPTYLAIQCVLSTDVLSCMKNITKVSDVIVSYLIQKTSWNPLSRLVGVHVLQNDSSL